MSHQPPRRTRIDPATFEAIRRALTELVNALPAKWRNLGAAVLAVLVALAAAFGWYETAPDAGFTATAILESGADVNIVRQSGETRVSLPEFDRFGHGTLMRATDDWKTHTVGVAPVLGWDLPYLSDLASGRRGLRYCADEITNAPVRETIIQAIRDTFDGLPGVQPSEANCQRYDLQLGTTPEQDCGSPLALGCAAWHGSYVRVTAQAGLPREAIYWTMVHEAKHALGLGHTGQYGGEGRGHGHCSDLGFMDIGVGGTNRPVDNSSGRPCIEDLQDGAGGYRWGFQDRPTAVPTPTAPPAPVVQSQIWFYKPDGARDCTIGGDGTWLVVTCAAGAPGRYWHRFTDGDFEEEGR